MKRSSDSWGAAALVALMTLLPAGLAGQEVTDTDTAEAERAILEVHATMRAAARARDADALFEYVLDTDIAPIIEDGRILPTHAEALRSTAEALRGLRAVSYDYTREDITMLSPTLALWVGAGRATATLADGRQITAPFAETMVLARREGGWKVLHAHRSAPER